VSSASLWFVFIITSSYTLIRNVYCVLKKKPEN